MPDGDHTAQAIYAYRVGERFPKLANCSADLFFKAGRAGRFSQLFEYFENIHRSSHCELGSAVNVGVTKTNVGVSPGVIVSVSVGVAVAVEGGTVSVAVGTMLPVAVGDNVAVAVAGMVAVSVIVVVAVAVAVSVDVLVVVGVVVFVDDGVGDGSVGLGEGVCVAGRVGSSVAV
jgi:hypothetical protein